MIFTALYVLLAVVFVAFAATSYFGRRKLGRAILIVGACLALVVTSPITVAWGMYYAASAECGHQPVEATDFAAAYSYRLPGDVGYSPGVWPFVPQYFCTEEQARGHGFHHVT